MSGENPEAVIRAYVQAWASHDVEKLVTFFTEDGIYEDVGLGAVSRGKPEIAAFVASGFVTFPDFHVELTSLFATTTRAAAEWIMSGTHLGDSPGLPATGKSIRVRGASILELQDGKIKRDSDYWDTASFLRQIGVLPTDAGT